MARKSKRYYKVLYFMVCFVMFAFGLLTGFSAYAVTTIKSDKLVFAGSDLQIHFLELGNINAGDCIYIRAGENDILVDAGSKSTSLPTIKTYLDNFVDDGVLEYAIVTHAHKDHYACFASSDSIFDYYKIGTLIRFSQTNNEESNMYEDFMTNLDEEEKTDGMITYTAKECVDGTNGAKQTFELAKGITLTILDSLYYHEESEDENNHSVCFLLSHGDNHYLFTGDLEKEGEEELVKRNDLPKCVLYKAGHHGSKTSSSDALLSVIDPDYVVVTCVAGSVEYTDNLDNTFPTQDFVDRVSKYTENVYVTTVAEIELKQGETDDYDNVSYTSMNGNIVVYSDSADVKFEFSNNDTILKDTEWFKEYRDCPDEWE
ncbi:MAG: MBL fold metallo-hydrolase [Clostridia bacterium]|nr:MBL fold metallo-hydrolase [Clostridia bacterium]